MPDDFIWPDDEQTTARRGALVDEVMEKNRQWRIANGLEAKEDIQVKADEITPETFQDRNYGEDPHLADRLGLNGPLRRKAPPPIKYRGPEQTEFDVPHVTDHLPDFTQPE